MLDATQKLELIDTLRVTLRQAKAARDVAGVTSISQQIRRLMY